MGVLGLRGNPTHFVIQKILWMHDESGIYAIDKQFG